MTLWRNLVLLMTLMLGIGVCHAQPAAADEPPTVSLLTFSPGDIYWERFGHNALLLRDAGGRSFVFNYGLFDFHQQNFFLNFARGKMLYRIGVDSLERTRQQYASEDRSIYEQRLDLTLNQRNALAEFLTWNLRPENIEYRYDYFADNCSTRVRDAIDRVTGGALRTQLQVQRAASTYRFEVERLMAPELPLMIGMDLGLGPRVDRPLDLWQQSFVPMTLAQALRSVNVTHDDGTLHPLVLSEGWMLRGDQPEPPDSPPSLTRGFALLGGLFAAAILLLHGGRRRVLARAGFALLAVAFALSTGLGGLVLTAAWALTDHWGMWANQNLLLLDPLALLLLPAWVASARAGWTPSSFARRLCWLILLGAVLTLLIKIGSLIELQQNLNWIVLLLPAQIALAGAMLWPRRPGWR